LKPNYNNRLVELRKRIHAAELDAMLITQPHNIFYLSGSNGGYTGARIALIIDRVKSTLVIDKRYLDEALEEAHADEIRPWIRQSYEDVIDRIKEAEAKKVGFESHHVTIKQFERIKKEFEGIQLVGVSGLVEPIREVKDEYEIKKIGEAAAIGDAAFEHIVRHIRPGMSELDIAIEIDFFMRKHGAEKSSFDTIVASGAHSSVPHATPSDKKVTVGDFVKLDFGAVIDGYHSDMTRTVVVGKASKNQKEIYNTVKKAQETSLNAVSAGKVSQDLDSIAREIIAEAGYGDNFVHSLGHGVGLNVHEAPTLAQGNESKLAANMVVTVEPGIYISGFGGVRIEDLVVVTQTGREVLTHSTKDLLEL